MCYYVRMRKLIPYMPVNIVSYGRYKVGDIVPVGDKEYLIVGENVTSASATYVPANPFWKALLYSVIDTCRVEHENGKTYLAW